MAFTRNFLKSLGLNDEQVQAVVEEHTAVTDVLKKFKEDAEKLPTVQKELDDLRKNTADYDEWKNKYTKEHQDFEDYKKDIDATNTLNKVKDAYKALLRANKVDDKRLDSIIKVTDFTEKKLDKDGKLENEKDLIEAIKKEWGDFIVTTGDRGTQPETPPAGNNDFTGTGANAQFIRERAARRHAGTYGEINKKGE